MSNVYDLTCPGPISLKEISSIVVVVELWRAEICAHLKNGCLHELDWNKYIQPRNAIPNLPSTIYNLLEEYATIFRESIMNWLYNNFGNRMSRWHRDRWMDILSRFQDFALDWDGTIHDVRTAKRMMLCDRLGEVEKFSIACSFCFEDDIKRIWPSVRALKDSNEINFYRRPQEYYWICYLRNELHKIPNPHDESIAEVIFFSMNSFHGRRNLRNRSSLMYFWNLLPSNSPSPIQGIDVDTLIVRFILPKLKDRQLDAFVSAHGVYAMMSLMSSKSTLIHVLPTWMFIRSKIGRSGFSRFITELLVAEAISAHFRSASVSNVFSEIWNSAADHLKRWALENWQFGYSVLYMRKMTFCDYAKKKFLITMLRDASFEARNAFWRKNWRDLMSDARGEDLLQWITTCFRSESEITQLREHNYIWKYGNIATCGASYLKHGSFKSLNKFLSLCCADVRKINEFKRQLLRSCIGESESSLITIEVVRSKESLNEFIDDAFQDTAAADLGVEFRNQLLSSRVTRNCLLDCMRLGYFVSLAEFVDTFNSSAEQEVVNLKKHLLKHFEESLMSGSVMLSSSGDLQGFLIWLLGSEDDVIRFKKSISLEDICRNMIPEQRRTPPSREVDLHSIVFKRESPEILDLILMWYFNEDEDEIDRFMKRFNGELVSNGSRKRRRFMYSSS